MCALATKTVDVKWFSYNIKYAFYQHDITVNRSLDHLADVALVRDFKTFY